MVNVIKKKHHEVPEPALPALLLRDVFILIKMKSGGMKLQIFHYEMPIYFSISYLIYNI